MPNYPYENEEINAPEQGTETPPEPAVREESYEEFDISSFDFTIADPGEIAEFSETEAEKNGAGTAEEAGGAETAPPEEGKGKKEKFSLRKLSKTISDKAAKLMEESPREAAEKREKPPKKKALRRPLEEPAVPEAKPEPPAKKKWAIHFTGGTFRQVSRRWMRYALRPSMLYENISEVLWPMFLLGVMLYFGAFYLTIGLDWYFAGLVSMGRLWAVAGTGLLVGGTAALTFAAGTQGLSLLCRKERIRPFRVISAVAGGCVYPACLLVLGLLIQLIFKASVSMSFGIMSVLWLTYVLLDVLRDLFGEKNLFKSSLLIVAWGFLLFTVMSLTFTLK